MVQGKMSLILNCTTCKYSETKVLYAASQNLTSRFVVCSNLYISFLLILFPLSVMLLTKLLNFSTCYVSIIQNSCRAKLCCAKGQSTVL